MNESCDLCRHRFTHLRFVMRAPYERRWTMEHDTKTVVFFKDADESPVFLCRWCFEWCLVRDVYAFAAIMGSVSSARFSNRGRS